MTATLDKIDTIAAAETKPAQAPRRKRVPLRRLVDWRFLVAGLFAAGLVHIAITFTTPRTAPATAMVRLKPLLPVNRAVLLPSPVPGKQPLPFIMPEALYVFCRFDLSIDSLRVSASLLEPGWTLSLHTSQGDNFYVMPAQQRRTDVSFLLVPGLAGADIGASPRRFGSADIQVPSPSAEGFMMVRAPLKGIAYRAEAEEALSRSSCAPVKR